MISTLPSKGRNEMPTKKKAAKKKAAQGKTLTAEALKKRDARVAQAKKNFAAKTPATSAPAKMKAPDPVKLKLTEKAFPTMSDVNSAVGVLIGFLKASNGEFLKMVIRDKAEKPIGFVGVALGADEIAILMKASGEIDALEDKPEDEPIEITDDQRKAMVDRDEMFS
jgi:UDP:flavonoid glycosyltransferase YjiC (YdhE family)